jgi:hypothetical protein
MSSAVGLLQPSFVINSADRLAPTSTNVEDFEIEIPLPPNNRFNKVSVSTIVIPNSFYNVPDPLHHVNPKVNQFLLADSTGNYEIVLTPGNYNYTNLPPILEALLNAASSLTYTVSLPNRVTEIDTTKLTFTVSPAEAAVIAFPVGSVMYKLLGFENISTLFPINPFSAGGVLISTHVCNFEFTKYITIKSNISLDSGNMSGDNAILGVVPVLQQNNGAVINYELVNLEDEAKAFTNNGSNRYRFSLYDDKGNPLFLNGRGWMTKIFTFEYNPYFELAIQDIQLRNLDFVNKQ